MKLTIALFSGVQTRANSFIEKRLDTSDQIETLQSLFVRSAAPGNLHAIETHRIFVVKASRSTVCHLCTENIAPT